MRNFGAGRGHAFGAPAHVGDDAGQAGLHVGKATHQRRYFVGAVGDPDGLAQIALRHRFRDLDRPCQGVGNAARQHPAKPGGKQQAQGDGGNTHGADDVVAVAVGLKTVFGFIELKLLQGVSRVPRGVKSGADFFHHDLARLQKVTVVQGGNGGLQALLHIQASLVGIGLGQLSLFGRFGSGHVLVPDLADLGDIGFDLVDAALGALGQLLKHGVGNHQPIAQHQVLDLGHVGDLDGGVLVPRIHRLVTFAHAIQANAANQHQQHGQHAGQNGESGGNLQSIHAFAPCGRC